MMFRPKTGIFFVFLTCTVLLMVLLLYGVFVEPNDIELNHVRIPDRELARVLGDKVVVLLSDLHIGTPGLREERILSMLEALQPDIIFLAGDYVPWQGDYAGAFGFLSRLKARIGIWGVLGDYDYSRSRQSCLFCHEQGTGKPTGRHGVVFLKNRAAEVVMSGRTLRIVGIDIEDEPSSLLLLQGGKGDPPVIALSHNPLVFDLVPDDQSVVLLAGDTHGGQVALPDWVFDLLGYRKNARYNRGLFEQINKKMYVSSGIGTSHLPIRLFRKPEVAVLHFVEGQDGH